MARNASKYSLASAWWAAKAQNDCNNEAKWQNGGRSAGWRRRYTNTYMCCMLMLMYYLKYMYVIDIIVIDCNCNFNWLQDMHELYIDVDVLLKEQMYVMSTNCINAAVIIVHVCMCEVYWKNWQQCRWKCWCVFGKNIKL